MQQYRFQLTGPGTGSGPGLLARIALGIVAGAMLVAAALLGAIFFLVALGFFAFALILLTVRIWWAKRKFEQAVRDGQPPQGDGRNAGRHAEVIEGEYRILRPREGQHGERGDR